jgi:hypothetical protein
MKQVLSTLLLLFPFFCGAQNYNCLQSGVRQYFTNSTHYLRGIEIDSITVAGTDTIYYPFKTFFSSSCWIGGKIIKQSNGTFLFNTYSNDTVIIKTQALPGDSWTFYNDTSPKNYKATIVAIDTMTFAGILDSVKRIRINAYNGIAPNPSDSADNLEFYLSKNNGFVSVFSIHYFPRLFDGDDPFTPAGARGSFTRSDYHNPTMLEVFNYNPGDVILSTEHNTGTRNYNVFTVVYDSVIARDSIDPYNIMYTLEQWRFTTTNHVIFGSEGAYDVTTHQNSTGIHYIVADTSHLLPQTMPEYPSDGLFPTCFHYNPEDTTHCITAPLYAADYFIFFEGCASGATYKCGLGKVKYEDLHFAESNLSDCVGITSSIYGSVKNGIACGNTVKPTPVSVAETANSSGLELFPNPSSGKYTIKAPATIETIAVYDIPGRLVFSATPNTQTATIDIAHLPNGLYLLKINGTETRKIIKQ